MNNIDGMKKMDAESVDLVVTSPPYDNLREYNDSSSWNMDVFYQVADEMIRVLKPGGIICWNVADAIVPFHGKKKGTGTSKSGSSFRQCIYMQDKGLNFHDNLIYAKHGPRFASNDKSTRYSNVYEYVFVMSKGAPNYVSLLKDRPNKTAGTASVRGGGGGLRTKDGSLTTNDPTKAKKKITPEFGIRFNIWTISNVFGTTGQTDRRAYEHPALMPNGLAADCIKSYSQEGDLVLDPFMGSGTTARQAYLLERDYIGFEIDPTYHKLCEEINGDFMNQGRLDFD